MINQHQFEQSARHFRSGRISLKEFTDRVFSGQKTAPHETKPADKTDQTLKPTVIAAENKPASELAKAVAEALSDSRSVLLTGVDPDTGQALIKEFTGGTSKLIIRSDIHLTPAE